MDIRKAALSDIPLIRKLAFQIWPEAYNEIISAEQIAYMLQLIYSTDALADQINKGHQFIFLIDEEEAVGFASFSQKSLKEPTIYRLHKLYVPPRKPARGAGSRLLDYIEHDIKQHGATQLELNVNKHNTAKIFYEKKGFSVLREEVLDIGEGFVMDDFVMVKDI